MLFLCFLGVFWCVYVGGGCICLGLNRVFFCIGLLIFLVFCEQGICEFYVQIDGLILGQFYEVVYVQFFFYFVGDWEVYLVVVVCFGWVEVVDDDVVMIEDVFFYFQFGFFVVECVFLDQGDLFDFCYVLFFLFDQVFFWQFLCFVVGW